MTRKSKKMEISCLRVHRYRDWVSCFRIKERILGSLNDQPMYHSTAS